MTTRFFTKVSCIFILLLKPVFSGLAVDLYISPNGNDTNAGTKQSPFRSIESAQKVLLQNRNENCTLWLASGFYAIEKPLIFDATNFNELNLQVNICAEKGAHPVISGGKLIKGWQKKAGLWEARLKVEEVPRELFIGAKRAIRARFPNNGYIRVKKVGDDRRTHFYFEKNDFPVPEKNKGTELVLLHDWSISRIEVAEIDEKMNKLVAVDSIGAKRPAFFNLDHWEKNPRYFLENAFEFLDAEYEWFYDAGEEKIFLKLPESQNPENLQIVVPVSNGLVRMVGTENHAIKNIHFQGITFQYAAWQIPDSGYCGVQACYFDRRSKLAGKGWMAVPAAVKSDWAENITFANCSFQNLGTSGLWFGAGCKNCAVKNSDFSDISGNGIMIGEGQDRLVNDKLWWHEAPQQVALQNTIENCTVTKCGAQFYGAVGIWCGLTAKTSIKNNELFNLPYSGVSIGWMWSPVPTPCRENVIDGNHIHHIMGILSDGGGIYSLGLQPRSMIVNNQIHDVRINAGRAESNGMFLDEGTTEVVVANNLIYNIAKSPLRFHKATTNIVKNNFLFCSNQNPPIRYNRTNQADIKQVDNKVFYQADEKYADVLNEFILKWNTK